MRTRLFPASDTRSRTPSVPTETGLSQHQVCWGTAGRRHAIPNQDTVISVVGDKKTAIDNLGIIRKKETGRAKAARVGRGDAEAWLSNDHVRRHPHACGDAIPNQDAVVVAVTCEQSACGTFKSDRA